MTRTWASMPIRNPLRSGARLVLASLLVSGCAADPDAPPRLAVDQSVCDGCSMLISEPTFAAAYRIDGRERLFDDLGCLLDALAAEEDGAGARVWVHDLESRDWLDAGEATFVRASALHTPMGSGLAALSDPAVARALAARTGGRTVLGFAELRREDPHAE
jgi:copper chaperone NosL